MSKAKNRATATVSSGAVPAETPAPAAPIMNEVEAPGLPEAEQAASSLAEPFQPATVASPLAETPAPAAPIAAALVKARVLAHCAHGKPDDVIELDPQLAKSLAGVVDTSPAAVKYAESLK